ncbi:MAG TPA: hypothetical protein ENI05_08630 [Porticoccus sp.]|nr:hypothetical protein [Porticoccus sp.]
MRFVKYSSMRSMSEAVSVAVDKGDVDLPLRLIHDFVERIFTEPLCVSQVFGSKTLDGLCQRIGEVNLAKIKREIGDAEYSQPDELIFVYIVTKLQKSGGHTRVIEDFIKARPEGQHVILSTELAGRSDSNYLLEGFEKKTNIVFEQAPKVNFQKRLTWLQKRLLKLHPGRVYLFNHHQDSVAVAAIRPEMKLNASFYHHGDHHLCLGVYLSHLEHIDPHPMGYHNCRDELGIKNIYIPLMVDDKGDRPADLGFFHDGKLTTCTAARSNKVEIPYFVSYCEMVPKLLKATGGKHIHIGRLSPWARLKIRRGLKHYGIQDDRFIYTPWVPSVWKALHDYRVDLYVASFPYGGGLTLIEAMGAGISVALHRHIFSRILSGVDLAYPGAFSWRQPGELLNYCVSLTSEDLEKSGKLARIQYEKFHSGENLQSILNDTDHGGSSPNDSEDTFSIESDEWALWVESQLNIRRLLSKAAYRTFRKLRSRLRA